MESRRLIRFGKNSFVISVPKAWVNENKLGKGDTVYVDNMSPELRIMPSEKRNVVEIKKIIIKTENKDLSRIRSEIISAYLVNYNVIELVGSNISENITSIKNTLRDLAGMEIMDLTSRRITAQDILSEEDVDIANLVRRVDMIVRSMITDSIRTASSDLYESINARDSDVNRLVFLAFRVLSKAMKEPQFAKKLNLGFYDVMSYWNMISELERIADQAKRAARHIRRLELDEDSRKEFERLYNAVNEGYLDTMKAYYTKDKGMAFRIIEECKTQNEDCDRFLEKRQAIEVVHSVEFVKAMNGQIKHIARLVSTV